jgi:hypothetical protein
MGNTPVLFDIRNPCKNFHRATHPCIFIIWNLRVLNEISTWETLLIQIISLIQPLKIIGINPCLCNIGLRYPGRLNKKFCRLLAGYSIKVSRESSRVEPEKTFWYGRHNQRLATVSSNPAVQIPGTHAGRTPVIPKGKSLLVNGQQRASENSAVFQKHPLDSLLFCHIRTFDGTFRTLVEPGNDLFGWCPPPCSADLVSEKRTAPARFRTA